MKRIAMLVSFVALATMLHGCDLFESDDDPVGPSSGNNTASGVVTTSEDGVIATESGASITISAGSVPPTADNNEGTMTFSIELADDQSPTLNVGETLASPVLRFGPSGFVFAQPIMITLPIDGEIGSDEVAIYRINPTTGENERYPAMIDTENNTISAFAYEFSPWFATRTGRTIGSSTAWGCVEFSSIYRAVAGCATDISLAFPQQDAQFFNGGSFVFGSAIGLSSPVKVWLPQGTYTFCLQHNAGSLFTMDFEKKIVGDVVVGADTYNGSCSAEVIYGGSQTSGMCECTPNFTPSAGTGDVQVTLTWHNSNGIDLDLHVTDPDGETVYFDNEYSNSGGHLDRDNACENYIDGRPENIYWSNAPAGKYKVEVDWYESCGSSATSQSFNVRVVNGSSTKTYHGSVARDVKVEVIEFEVTQSGLVFNPIEHPVEKLHRPRLGKR